MENNKIKIYNPEKENVPAHIWEWILQKDKEHLKEKELMLNIHN